MPLTGGHGRGSGILAGGGTLGVRGAELKPKNKEVSLQNIGLEVPPVYSVNLPSAPFSRLLYCCIASSSRSVLLLRWKRPSRSWCALLVEEQVRGGLLPHETFLWGAVASATPLRGRCGGAAKERIRARQGLEEARLLQTPAFSPSLLTGSSAHMFIRSPPHEGQLMPCQ